MGHMLLVTTVLDSANTGSSQKVLLDNAIGPLGSGWWFLVLGLAHFSYLKIGQAQGRSLRAQAHGRHIQGSRSLSLSWCSLIL